MGDNLDISIKSRYMRAGADLHNQSLHYFQFLAVRDRIDFSGLEIAPNATRSPQRQLKSYYPIVTVTVHCSQNSL